MKEKFMTTPEGWPKGTEIKISNGKKEIILPEPTDMNEFSCKQLSKDAKISSKQRKPINPQFRIIEGGRADYEPKKNCKTRDTDPRRQEQIIKNRRDERKFAERQDVAM